MPSVSREGGRFSLALLAALWLALAPARAAATSVAFVPLDDRPVTLQLPVMLGAIAGQTVLTPPRPMVGHYLTPGDPDAIFGWLQTPGVTSASAVVASSDMLVYGGLVASRTPGVSLDRAFARLRRVASLRAQNPVPFFGIFGTIMRLAPTGVPADVSGYWATGSTVDAIQAYANLPDPPVTADDRAKAARLRATIGADTLDAYLASRRRNLLIDEAALRDTANGAFDRIVIGQDDAGPVGLHLRDVAALQDIVDFLGLERLASIEPGADELGMVMLARAFARNVGWRPNVAVRYSRLDGASYQDRLEYVPIDTTIARLIAACGARRVADAADVELFVRVPETNPVDEAAFEDAIAVDVAAGRSVAVADLSFLSGGPGPEQQELTRALIARGLAGKLDAFASWNTNANTVGTALAAAVAAGAGRRAGRFDPRAQAEFMLDRYIDDYAFHQFVRPVLNDELRARGIDTTLLSPEIAREASDRNRALLWPYALELLAEIYPQYRDAGLTITLPWQRTFETQIDVRLALRR
jgi:hypothetical protein